MRKALLLILAFLLLGVAAPGFAQRCDNVKIRLWVGKDSSDSVWHRRGETVSIPAGAWARIAVYVEGAGKVPSTTQAQVGFVGDVGLAGGPGPREVRQVVDLSPQGADDRQNGRIVLSALAAGSTELGYRIEGVTAPDRLDAVPEACRSGRIPLRVTVAVPPQEAGLDEQTKAQATRKCQNQVNNRIVDDARRAASQPAGGITLYASANYRGRSATFTQDQPSLTNTEIGNDRVSSIRVAAGCKATLFSDADYRGRAIEVTRDVPMASTIGLNDQTSSVRVECAPAGYEVEEVRFDQAVDTWQIQPSVIGVRGGVMARSGGRWDQYSYECSYDTHRGEITGLDYTVP